MQQQAAEFFLTSESVYFEPTFSRPARTRAVPETQTEARPSRPSPVEETRPKKRKTGSAVKDGLSESARAVATTSAPTSAPAPAQESAPASVPASPASPASHAGGAVARICGIPRGNPRAGTAAGTVMASQAQSATEAKPVPPKLTPAPFFAIARDHSLARAKNGTKA